MTSSRTSTPPAALTLPAQHATLADWLHSLADLAALVPDELLPTPDRIEVDSIYGRVARFADAGYYLDSGAPATLFHAQDLLEAEASRRLGCPAAAPTAQDAR